VTGFVAAARRDKLAALRALGVEPFAYRFDRTTTAAAAVAGFREGDETVHRLAGRLVALRPHGKTTFAHLEDATGRLQLYFKRDDLGEAGYAMV
jgi:lysyl-tRNA synthetase class 2